jgi:hypothetical protein
VAECAGGESQPAPAPAGTVSQCETVTTPALASGPRLPDLHELIDQFRGYDAVSPDAWSAHDAALERWKQSSSAGPTNSS